MLDILTRKRCTRCGQKKPISEFHKTNQIKSGHSTWCELCYRAYHISYYYKNDSVVKERAKTHYNNNKERHIFNVKKWGDNNPDRVRASKKRWKQNNPDKTKASDRACKRRHPETSKVHYHNRRARIKGNGGEITKQEWLDLLEICNYTCLSCLKRDVKLTLDHILPLALGGKNTIGNAQPLCKPCNSRKGVRCIDYRPLFIREIYGLDKVAIGN